MLKAKKTKRLENEILTLTLNVSSINASKYLSKKVAKVYKSIIFNLLKKEIKIKNLFEKMGIASRINYRKIYNQKWI